MIFSLRAISTPEQFYLLYSLQITGYFLDNHLEHGTRVVARVAFKRVLATLSSDFDRTVRAMWRETTTFENCRATHRESEIWREKGGKKRGRRIQLFDNGKLNNTEGKNAVSFLLEGGLNIREKVRNVKLSRKATREESLKGFGHWVKIVLRIFHVPTPRRLGKNSNNSDEIFPSTNSLFPTVTEEHLKLLPLSYIYKNRIKEDE